MNDKEMRKDEALYRTEWSIIPRLLLEELISHGKHDKEIANCLSNARGVLNRVVEELAPKGRAKRRYFDERFKSKILPVFHTYFDKHKFTPRKGIFVLTAWADSLDKAMGLEPQVPEYIELMSDFNRQIEEGKRRGREGDKELASIEKVDKSALKHVAKIHAIAQQLNYF